MAKGKNPEFTTDFRLEDCKFVNTGANPYFILEPGYQLVLEGEEEQDGELIPFRVVTTALDETKATDLEDEGIGLVKTRVVEERECVDGLLVDVSRNFFARCKQTKAI